MAQQLQAKVKKRPPAQAGKKAQRRAEEAPFAERRWRRFSYWQLACAGLLLAAAYLRLCELSAKVFHHDEGVNGMFMANLFMTGYYHYDPANYHGPTLYYAGLVTTNRDR